MVGLEARGERAAGPEERPGPGRMDDPPGDEDELVDVAELGDRGGGDAGQPAPQPEGLLPRSGQEPVLQPPDREPGDLAVNIRIDVVVDAHHVVDATVGGAQGALVKMVDREPGEDRAGRLAFGLGGGREPGVPVPCLGEVGGAEETFEPDKPDRPLGAFAGIGLVGPRRRHGDRGERVQVSGHHPTIPSARAGVWGATSARPRQPLPAVIE